jgi:putative peptidoglycan lipid II flippase
MRRPLRIWGAAAVLSSSVLLSRILGLGREALLAGLIGVNAEGDLYRQAFTIPDFLNYLLAGAFLGITLIPILSRYLESDDPEAASRAFTSVFRFVTLGILALSVVMWLFADDLVRVVFPEVADRGRLVHMTRLALPAQVFVVSGTVLMSVQLAHRRFMIPALAGVVYNLGIIVGGLIGAALGDPSPESFIWGAVGGAAVGNLIIQWFGARATGTWFKRLRRGESVVREYLVLAIPLMIGQSIAVLDEQFVRLFGQMTEGATSALFFARTLNMVPVGVIGGAAGVAAYPFLSRLAARGEIDELVATTGKVARNTVFIGAAATAGLVVLAAPLVRILYRYGQFTGDDADLVASLLMIYAFSIPAWGMHQILSRHFYAKRKMWTPVLIGTLFTALAVPTWLTLNDALGVQGFALASTLIMTGYAMGMLIAWGVDSGWSAVRALAPSFARGVAAAGVAGLAGVPVVRALLDDEATLGTALAAAGVGGVTAMGAFIFAAWILRSPELGELASRVRRR